MRKYLLALLLVTGLFAISFGLKSVTAQIGEATLGSGLRISPTRDERTIERGQFDQVEITIENVTQLPIIADVTIEDFLPAADGSGAPRIITDPEVEQTPYSIRPFTSEIDVLNLAPEERKIITLDINIPEDASPGSYFGLVRLQARKDEVDYDGSSIGLNTSVGTLILFTIPGDTVEILDIEKIEILKDEEPGTLFESAPNQIAVSLVNQGNVFSQPFGKVAIKDWRGNLVYEYEINATEPRGNALPASTRTFINDVEGISSFGKYSVETNISYGQGSSILNVKKSFWVMPWRIMLVGLAILLLILFMSFRGLKMYNRWVVRKSKGANYK